MTWTVPPFAATPGANGAAESTSRVPGEDDVPPFDGKVAPAWHDRITPAEASWYTEPPAPRDWLMRDRRPLLTSDGYLVRGKTGQMIAEGGGGKTTALNQFAVAVATGTSWLDTFDVVRPGRVLVLLGEEDAGEARRKQFNATREGPVPPPGSIVFLPMFGVECAFLENRNGNLAESTFYLEFKQWLVDSGPWDLIILDPLSRLGGPECETDNAAATRFVEAVEALAVATQAAVIVAHHTAKVARGGGAVTAAASRGASALVDGFRWQVSLAVADTDIGEVITLSHTKSNYSRRAEPLLLKRAEEGRLVPLTPEEVVEATAAMTGEAARKAKGAEKAAEAEERASRRQAQAAAAREARTQKRAAEESGRRIRDDLALIAVLRERPGITTNDLRGALAVKLGGCSRDRMDEIVARLGEAVTITTAPATHAKAHRLAEDKLPEAYR